MTENPRERWLGHCSPTGQRPTTVRLSMTGHIKLRAWLPFVASQWIDAQQGFVWAARVGRRPLVISGSDQYLDGSGEMQWKLWRFAAVHQVGDEEAHIEVAVDADGRVVSVSGPRWGNPLGKPFGYYRFGVDMHAEATSAGITVPSAFRASWFHGGAGPGRRRIPPRRYHRRALRRRTARLTTGSARKQHA